MADTLPSVIIYKPENITGNNRNLTDTVKLNIALKSIEKYKEIEQLYIYTKTMNILPPENTEIKFDYITEDRFRDIIKNRNAVQNWKKLANKVKKDNFLDDIDEITYYLRYYMGLKKLKEILLHNAHKDVMDKLKKFLSVGDDYTDYSEEDISTDAEKSAADRTAVVQGAVKTRGNLVALPSTKSMPKQEIVVFNVVSGGRSSQTKGIADYLTQNKCVIVNVAAADNEMRRRTLDFLSGISFAMGGSKARVADYVYVFAPSSMTISNAQPDGSDEDSGLTPSGGDNGEYGDYEGYRGPYR